VKHLRHHELCEYLNDSLDEGQNRDLESHLEDCPACLATLQSIVDTSASFLGSAFQKSSTINVNSTFTGVGEETNFGLGNRFLVLSELARGGMGIVYRGYDRELKRQVAIKVLKKGQDTASHRFYREAQISGQLQHPGIVPIHETGRLEDGRIYIAMKLVIGQTLRELVEGKAGSQNLPELLGVFGQVCETLAYAHSRNIIHRDLKPDNVMVGKFGEVQVMDWGLAKKLHGLESVDPDHSEVGDRDSENDGSDGLHSPLATVPGRVFGTPAFMPPEQAHGRAADHRADVFALGGILFYLLTGQVPFDAPTKTLAIEKSQNHDVTKQLQVLEAKELDDGLVAIVEACLAPNVENRPSDAGEVNDLFKSYLTGRTQRFEEIRIQSARASERLVAQQKRNRQVAWFLTCIIAALLSTAVAGYLYLTEKNRRAFDMANAELEQVKRQSETENKIRVGLTSARNFQKLANESDAASMPSHWQAALFEIKQAKTLADESISEPLLSELESVGAEVQSQANRFFEVKARQEDELACQEIIEEACYESLYPPSLRLALLERLTDKFAAAYEKIGITPGDLSDVAANRIANSPCKPFLIHGLLLWRIEVGRESRRFGPRPDDQENRLWLHALTKKADLDPFRAEIRDAIDAKEFDKLEPLFKSDEAVGSLATVLLCTPLIETLPNVDDRLNYLLRAQQFFPDDFQLQWKLSAVNGMEKEAKRELGFRAALACFALQPDNPAVLMNLGATYIQQGNYDLAVELLEQVVEVAPNFIDAQCNLANAYWKNGKHDLAIQCCEIVLDQFPDHSWATQVIARIREELGQYDQAIIDFKRAAKANPQSGAAQFFLHSIYLKRGEVEEAAKWLEKVIEIHPSSVGDRKKLAALYVKMEKWDLAEAAFQSILERKPKSTSTIASLANVYLIRNRPQKSEELLRETILNGLNSHSIQLELAKSLLAQSTNDAGKQSEGLRILEKLKQLEPKMTEPAELLREFSEKQADGVAAEKE